MATNASQSGEASGSRKRMYGSPKLCPKQGWALYEYQITPTGAYLKLKENHCADTHHPVAEFLAGFSIGNAPNTDGFGYDVPLWQGDLVVVCCVSHEKTHHHDGETDKERNRLIQAIQSEKNK